MKLAQGIFHSNFEWLNVIVSLLSIKKWLKKKDLMIMVDFVNVQLNLFTCGIVLVIIIISIVVVVIKSKISMKQTKDNCGQLCSAMHVES